MSAEVRSLATPVTVSVGYYLKQREFEDALCAGLGDKSPDVYSVSDRFISFDLSGCYWYDLGATLWLIMLLHKLKKQRNELQLILPEPNSSTGDNLWSFLLRWRFFEALAVCVDDPLSLLPSGQHKHLTRRTRYALAEGDKEGGESTFLHTARLLEITPFGLLGDATRRDAELEIFLRQFGDKVIITALSRLCGWTSDEATRFTADVISEGVRNSSFHAQGSFALVAMRLDKRLLTLSIGDNGRGIPHVLRSTLTEAGARRDLKQQSDADLIKYFAAPQFVIDSHLIRLSVQKGVTSAKDRPGLGLYYLKTRVLGHGGELRIRSGKACVDFTTKGEEATDNWPESPGTMLRIKVPLTH